MAITHREMPMRATVHNRLAAEYVRKRRGRKHQDEFAQELSAVLGVTISVPSLSYYESASQTIPAAVLLAAQQLTRRMNGNPSTPSPQKIAGDS